MAYKEKDTKKWTAQWFETNAKGEKKKRRKRGFETKREALEYERQKKLNNSRSMDMKLSEFMEVYFEDKQNELKERTMKNKRYMMEQHIIPYFGNQMMSEITAGQIIQWQNEMQTKGFSEAYLRMIQNQLSRTMAWNVSLLCTITNAGPIIISILSFRNENCLMSLWRRLQQEICFMTKTESMYALKKRYWMKSDSFGVAVKSFPRARYMSVIFLP